MSKVGYYRYRYIPANPGTFTIAFFQGGAKTAEHTVIVRPKCTGDRVVKYLDKNGQYRYFNFNRFWTSSDKASKIGANNVIVRNLLSGKGATESIGKTNTRTLSLYADVDQDELTRLNDMYYSPRCYLYVGDGLTFQVKDWVEVDVEVKDGANRIAKGHLTPIDVTVTLPQYYTITMM